MRVPRRRTAALAAIAAFLCLSPAPTAAQPADSAAGGFVGETTCGNNKDCHGAPLPVTAQEKAEGKPLTWARTQWLRRDIDRHSDAFNVLKRKDSGAAAIAAYMAIDPATSDKCLVCHAPSATPAKSVKSGHRLEDGVSCEHCHGPAEAWVNVHTQKEVWKERRKDFVAKGLFYDNSDLRQRAQKCASCHVQIDHEILAAGHPPLQFEMVAYAQVMKHWDDRDKLPAFDIDPTLWAIGQVTGLRHAARMVGERAGNADYQSLGKFQHFADKNCYQCHHKLVDDALRQAQGHYAMVEFLLETANPGKKAEVAGMWNELTSAAAADPQRAQQAAARLAEAMEPIAAQLQQKPLDREATRAILKRITASGDRIKGIRRFHSDLPDNANVSRIDSIGTPWWYTTGAPEQAILAILSLCRPGFGEQICGKSGIQPDIKALLAATDRAQYDPNKFAAALARVNSQLK